MHIFVIRYTSGENWLGKSPPGISTLEKTNKQYKCRHDIWLPMLHMDSNKKTSVLPVEGNHTILFWGMCTLPRTLSLQTESNNWVLWGPQVAMSLVLWLLNWLCYSQANHCVLYCVHGRGLWVLFVYFFKRVDGNIYTDCNLAPYSVHILWSCVPSAAHKLFSFAVM